MHDVQWGNEHCKLGVQDGHCSLNGDGQSAASDQSFFLCIIHYPDVFSVFSLAD